MPFLEALYVITYSSTYYKKKKSSGLNAGALSFIFWRSFLWTLLKNCGQKCGLWRLFWTLLVRNLGEMGAYRVWNVDGTCKDGGEKPLKNRVNTGFGQKKWAEKSESGQKFEVCEIAQMQ